MLTKAHSASRARTHVGYRVFCISLLLVSCLWSVSLINAADLGSTVFGPETFVRSTGKPKVERRNFSVTDPAAQYVVQIENGLADGRNRVSSAVVHLNGSKIVVPKDLNQNVAGLNIPVSLQSNNLLKVKLASKPGSFLTISICRLGEGGDGSDLDCNSLPVANAGPDQSVLVGSTVQLDASASTDIDGDPLTYAWSFLSVPPGSGATLSDTGAVMPEFIVDLSGTYIGELVVNDGLLDSVPDTVRIDTQNSAPVADAGADQTVFVTDVVVLDGRASSDVDGNPLTYSWTLISKPAGSVAALDNPNVIKPSFATDLPGTYIAQLIVNDAQVDSTPEGNRQASATIKSTFGRLVSVICFSLFFDNNSESQAVIT